MYEIFFPLYNGLLPVSENLPSHVSTIWSTFRQYSQTSPMLVLSLLYFLTRIHKKWHDDLNNKNSYIENVMNFRSHARIWHQVLFLTIIDIYLLFHCSDLFWQVSSRLKVNKDIFACQITTLISMILGDFRFNTWYNSNCVFCLESFAWAIERS